MPWNRNGDTGATHPALMRVASIPVADSRSVNEVAGFYWRLTNLSSAHTTDYIVDAGTVEMIGGANVEQLLKLATKTGLLRKIRHEGLVAYQLLNDPEFVHIRTRAEIEWTRQQKADTSDLRIAVPVRLRDGDLCRYCGVVVTWAGRTSGRRGTLDHTQPGQPGTAATMVVACVACNSSMRDEAGEERLPLLDPPATPFYSATTAKWLTKNGHPVTPTDGSTLEEDERPGSQPDNATSDPAASRVTRTADSDPAKAGHRAADGKNTRKNTGPTPRGNAPPNAHSSSSNQPEEMHSSGSGRDRSGNASSSRPVPADVPARRRKRSSRSRPSAQRNGDL